MKLTDKPVDAPQTVSDSETLAGKKTGRLSGGNVDQSKMGFGLGSGGTNLPYLTRKRW